MPPLVDRTMMESVFPPQRLKVWVDGKLPAELHDSARSILTSVGLPRDRSSFFQLDGWLFEGEDAPNRFRTCSEIDHSARYKDMPQGWETWLIIGEIFYDVVVLDPVSGAVHCLPDGDYRAHLLNQSLDSFTYFTYLLEAERPAYDFTLSDHITDSEGVAVSLRERMVQADPVPFDGVEPAWSGNVDREANTAPRMPTWDAVLANVYESVG